MIKQVFLIIIGIQASLFAQDPQFSQFYNSPLVINPAFTGTSECFRTGTAARTQWIGLDKPFNTAYIFADVNAFPINSGFGIMALYDQIGHAKIATTELSGLYSYHVQHNGLNLQLGLQGTYVNRSIDYSKLIFEDQFSGTVLTDNFTIDPITANTKASYFDLSAGALFFADDHYWIGASAHHINQPNQAFYTGQSTLNVKYSVHGGMVWQTNLGSNSDLLTFYPCALFKSQSTFDQLDFGAFAYYKSVMLGVFYRGIFLQRYEGVFNNDAIQFHFGYNYTSWKFYYSYDLTTSRLKVMNTLGSHELSITKTFCVDIWPHEPNTPMKNKLLACPDFKKGTLKRRESWKTQWDVKHQRNVHTSRKTIHENKKVRRHYEHTH